MTGFADRTILISAAADGLGLAMATRFAAEGGTVVALDKSTEAIDRARALPEAASIRFEAVDLMEGAAISATIDRLASEGLRFDTLINNAGGSLHTPRAFLEESDEDWDRVMGLNVTAAVRLTRAVLPHMMDQGFGRIINLGSKAGRYGSLFTGANYVAAKGAVQSMTLQLAQEFGPHGITCNAVCPGAILTPRVERLLSERMTQAERDAALAQIPVRRNGQVEDVAAAVAFFASRETGFITGQMLDVNGGQGMCS
ncbi:SDR family oxidoreductase [Roseovarius nubinhibens]|uniref:SDR family NAD(P)-dependent oxidoreductase n=1 Tax=Roseovarius nubinhibens TaxID=314263 RepID=UPI001C09AFD6|nr:SDR family NAD(P)-dependent oxidoreductase [Roseovarius nubinhibens]MBU3001580.1 SDR family oxidoreductase [Roseovarius nubinhibens]